MAHGDSVGTQTTARSSRALVAMFLLGLGLGVAAGIAPILVGILGGTIAAIVMVVLASMVRPRYAALSGVAGGIGMVWLYGTINTVAQCQGTADFCGNTNPIPLLLASVAALAVCVLGALVTARRPR